MISVSEKQKQRTLEFIENHKNLKNPIKIIAREVLLEQFGIPDNNGASTAKTVCREIILDLEKSGHIECLRSRRGISGVNFIRNGLHQESASIVIPPTKEPEPEIVKKDILPIVTQEEDAEAERTRAILAQIIGGRKLSKSEIMRRGERHENWLHISLIYMVHVLSSQYPDIILYGSCSRSGRHDPTHGKIDLEDSWGADVTLYLVTKPLKDISLQKGRIIYDSKGSYEDVVKFNQEIRRYPGQTSALKKKAIWANIFKRSQKDLIAEVLQDIIEVGLLPSDFNKDGALEFFED